MTEQTTDKQVEALARLALDAIKPMCQEQMRQNGPDSYPTNEFTLNMACVQVDAILRALGCADEKGEVFVPDIRAAVARDISAIQRAHTVWVKHNFPHMTKNELMLAHAGGVAEEYFELGQAIGPLVRAGIKCVNQIKPEDWSRERVSDALADMLIFACQLAESFGIDLGEVVASTAAEVQQRDWVNHREQTWTESKEVLTGGSDEQ